MILLPKYKDIYISPPKTTIGMQGFFRLQTINKFSGKVRIDTGWFPNLILTTGRNEMGKQADWMSACQVGTDNTAPNIGQAGLLGRVDGTTTVRSDITGAQTTTSPYYSWRRMVFRVPEGAIGGENLQEVGIGWSTIGTNLVSRALILDPILQTPTVVTPLADELLDVTYEMRYYPPIADITSPSITLNSVIYDTITRAAEVNGSAWQDKIGTIMAAYDVANWLVYDGNIGTQLQNPSGTSTGLTNSAFANETYSDNSYERVMSVQMPIQDGNLVSGIRSVRIRTAGGSFQTQFGSNPGGNTIPKDSNYNMLLKWKIAWDTWVAP